MSRSTSPSTWPARPDAGTPLSAHALEVGDRIANLLTSRPPEELREIGRALGLPRHRLACGLLHALHAHDSEQEWLEAATGSTRAYGVWDVEAQVADDLHTDDLVAGLVQGIGAEEPAAWSDAQVRGVEAALLWELCQLAGQLLDITTRPSATGGLWQALGGGRLVAHRRVAGAARGLVTARVWPAKPQNAEDEGGEVPVWGPGAVRDAGWRWSVGWDDPTGQWIDHEQQGGPSQRVARWAAEPALGEVVADAPRCGSTSPDGCSSPAPQCRAGSRRCECSTCGSCWRRCSPSTPGSCAQRTRPPHHRMMPGRRCRTRPRTVPWSACPPR